MKKRIIVICISIFAVAAVFYNYYSLQIHTEKKNNHMETFEQVKIAEVDVSAIADLPQPQHLRGIKDRNKKKLSSEFDTYKLLASDSINLQGKFRIDNGLVEMITCKYVKESDISINISIYHSNEIAKDEYKLELKYSKEIVKQSEELNNQWFISSIIYIEDVSIVNKVCFQKGNLVITIIEDTNNRESNINNVIYKLEEIFADEFDIRD